MKSPPLEVPGNMTNPTGLKHVVKNEHVFNCITNWGLKDMSLVLFLVCPGSDLSNAYR